MMEVLHALEAEVARLAARRMTKRERSELKSIHQKAKPIVARNDVDAYLAANAEFHGAIYAGARNDYMADQIRSTRLKLNFHRQSSLQWPGRISASWTEHGRAMDAIAIGDELAARDAMAEHCSLGGTAFADMIATLARDAS
jgi:DNA-binding GntR family transcriptional regulator